MRREAAGPNGVSRNESAATDLYCSISFSVSVIVSLTRFYGRIIAMHSFYVVPPRNVGQISSIRAASLPSCFRKNSGFNGRVTRVNLFASLCAPLALSRTSANVCLWGFGTDYEGEAHPLSILMPHIFLINQLSAGSFLTFYRCPA